MNCLYELQYYPVKTIRLLYAREMSGTVNPNYLTTGDVFSQFIDSFFGAIKVAFAHDKQHWNFQLIIPIEILGICI